MIEGNKMSSSNKKLSEFPENTFVRAQKINVPNREHLNRNFNDFFAKGANQIRITRNRMGGYKIEFFKGDESVNSFIGALLFHRDYLNVIEVVQ